MNSLHNPNEAELAEMFTDVTGANSVEIVIQEDDKVVWINVNGVCLLRICRIEYLNTYRGIRKL